MNRKFPWLDSFWCGWVIATALESLFQDFIGQEAIMERVTNHWGNPWISIPVAVLALCWCAGSGLQPDKQEVTNARN